MVSGLTVVVRTTGEGSSGEMWPGYYHACPTCCATLDSVLGSLVDLGRVTRCSMLRTSDVGAPHRRERVDSLASAVVASFDQVVTLPSAQSSIRSSGLTGTFGSESTQLADNLAVVVWDVVALAARPIDPLLPKAAWLEESGRLIMAEFGVKVQECPQGGCLVAVEVRAAQISIEVGGQKVGVRGRAEGGQGDEYAWPAKQTSLASRSSPRRARNSVLRATAMNHAAVWRSRHPPSSSAPSS